MIAERVTLDPVVNISFNPTFNEGITSKVRTGDDLEIDLSNGEIRNLTTGAKLKSAPLPESLMQILQMGGYIPYMRKKMAMGSSKK